MIDGETGIVAEPLEPKAVALAIVSLLDDPLRAAKYGRAGRARVEAGFTWARRAEGLARILADAAG